MPNLLLDFTKGFIGGVAPESLTDLKSDAESIRDAIMGGARTAQDKYREIRKSNLFRKTTDWFFHRGEEFGEGSPLEDDRSDEFDAGFKFGNDESDSEPQTKVLDYNGMKDLTRGQVSSMYQIAGKQTEASAMTASEIITTVNTRSSEILSSLSTINSSLQTISGKLDKLIELGTISQQNSYRSMSLFDANGNLTLGNTFKYIKENNPFQEYIEGAKQIGMIGSMIKNTSTSLPEGLGMIAGLIGTDFVADKRLKILDNRSLNDIRDAIDERVSSAQNNLLSKLLDWDKFRHLFGDLTSRETNKDYSRYIDNQYNREKATFDNMTRKTIIDVIPGYLRRITAALTGENLYVSSEGSLTTERPAEFQNVFNQTVNTGFSDKRLNDIYESMDSDIDRNDVFMAQRVLVSLYVFREMRVSGKTTKSDDFENGGDPDVNAKAVQYLTASGGKDAAYWEKVIGLITTKLISDKNARNQFARTIRQTAAATNQSAIRYAENATITYDIGEITDDIEDSVVSGYIKRAAGKDERTWAERVRAKEIKEWEIPKGVDPNSRASDEEFKRIRREQIKRSEVVGNVGQSIPAISTMTTNYVASIFALLNRGVNVYSVKRSGPFKKMKLLNIFPETATTSDTGTGETPPAPSESSTPPTPTESTDTSSTDGGSTETNEQPPTVTPPTPDTNPEQPNPNENPQHSDDDKKTDSKPEMPSITVPTIDQQSQSSFFKSFNDIKEKVMRPLDKMKTNIMTDFKSLKSATYDKATVEFNRVMAQRQAASLGNSESADDKNDKMIADAVLASMNAAVQDGDTKEDAGPLMQQISAIKNPKLKSQLTKVVEGTLQRADTQKPAQSKIGKVLTWGLALVKGFILPKLQSAKTFITALGKKLLTPILNSLKQSGQRIANGARAVKEGLFGSEDTQGLFGRKDKKPDTQQTQPSMDSIGRMDIWTAKLNQQSQKSKDKSEAPTMQSIDQQGVNEIKQDVKKLVQNGEEQKKGGFITEAMSNFVEKFKQTDFGKGFMSAFENKTTKNKEMKPETLSDQMTKSIVDILKSKDGSGSVFGSILTKITSIGDVIKEGIDKMKEKNSTESTSTSTNANQNGMPSIGGDASATGGESSPTMPSIETSTPTMPSISTAGMTGATGATGAATSAASAAAAGAAKGGLGFSLGKILGGITGILGGLLQAAITVVLSMKGFKEITKLIMKVLKTSLQPLNRAFKSLYKSIKPVMKMIQKILKQIVGYLVDLVESIIEILQPIFEMIGPLLEQLFELLKPFLEMITNMVNKLIVPLTALMQVVVVPILQTIANSVEFIWGLLEVGFGNVLRGIGTLCIITGFIPKLFGVGALFDTGKVFIEEGNTHVQQGSEHVKTAMASQFELYKSFLTGDVAEKKEQEPERETKYRNEVVSTLNGSPMDGIYGSGDVYNIYGAAGANQNMFGNYMNMGARGCGPVALADAYARRSGSPVNARTLTSAMSASGAYNPNMGTSVAGFVNAAGSMGMGLHAGGVTPASLKQATPNNPITIVGSGTDFTTRRGNNHYMNVVGTSGGTAYVSNPMNGRIERRSVTSLAANSLVGLYGSGDNIPKMDMSTVYGSGDVGSSISGSSISFSDEVQEALSVLKDLVSGIVGMFTGEESMESQLATEKNKAAYDKTMVDLGSLTDEEKQALENKAYEAFKSENPRFENETDAEYEKRFRKENTYKRYMTKAATNNLYDATKKTAGSYDDYFNELLGEVDAETGERSGGSSAALLKSLTEKDQSVQQGAFFSKLQDMIGDYWDEEEESGFYSDNGARLYTDEYTPSVFDTSDAVNWKKSKGQQPDIPLIEWLKYNMPEMYGMSSAYKRYGTTGADAEVQGLDGADHTGTDFAGPEGTPIRAFTDGVVTWKGFDDSGGNMIVIEDVGGDLHKYMHMMEPSELTIGDEVFGGDVIGYIGSTGNSTGPHLHYQIQTNDNSMLYNPHTFFKWYEGSSSSAPYGPIDFTGQLGEGNIWDSYKNRTGVSKFMQTAFDAGLTGPEVATITSTGIWEDGGEKLWGSKSLLDTTYDVNGQAARGIMNWVDPNVDYGNTVGEQLQYIQRTYFDGDSTDFRAQVRDTGFDAQDLAAYNTATGRNGWVLNYGDLYGPYMNEEDLVEGSEHFFRGALVPGCIHTVEGPRKYIGTAVGVYNWLLDEGYIDNYGDASNINYGSYVEVPTSLTENNGFGLMAANDAYQSAIDQTDKTDGTPYRYSETSSGKTGTAYNKAGQKLFDYYVPVKNTNADKHWVDKHDYTKHIANFGNGKFVEIYIDKNGYALTTAGSNAKALIEKYDNDKNIKNNANTPGIISTSTTDSDLRKIWRSIYTRYSADYANQLSRGDMIADFNSGRATHNGMTVYYDTSDGNLYYKNYKSAGRIKVAGGQVVWPDVSPAQTNTGTNVINGGNVNNTSTTTTTTTVVATPPTEVVQTNNGTNVINTPETSTSTVSTNTNEHSAAVSYIDAMNEWHERTFGSGDTNSVQVYGGGNGLSSQLDNMFSIDSYMPDQTSPVIVNNYPVDTTNSDVIDMLMSNTYNIRSKEIESLLTGMLQMMKDRKSKKQSSSTKTRTSKQSSQDAAFPEQGIPRQVTRLSIG